MSFELQTGAMLGRYELLAQIGRGGMASVWVARERSPTGKQRLVAVKALLPALARRSDFRTMFLEEGQTIRSIEHDNVVTVYEVAEDHGLLYMAMEWIEGDSLRTVIKEARKRRAIPAEMAVRMIADTAAGLHAAHELRGWDGELRNLVHCDVSPHNILIGLEGVTKLTDFGVASAEEHLDQLQGRDRVKGKFGYMSPEQAQGLALDRRSDLFALGIVLFELTTGERLFKGRDNDHTIELVVGGAIPTPSSLKPDYPPALEAIVMRALERDPARRFQTAEELGQALDRYLVSERIMVARAGVAQLLKRVVGARIEQRRDSIRSALALVDGAASGALVPSSSLGPRVSMPSVTELSSPSASFSPTDRSHPSDAPSWSGSISSVGGTSSTGSHATTTAATSRSKPAPKERAARSPWLFAIGTVVGVAAGIAAVVAVRNAQAPTRIPLTTVQAAAAASSGTAPKRKAGKDDGIDIDALPVAGDSAGRTFTEDEKKRLEDSWKNRNHEPGDQIVLAETPDTPAAKKPGSVAPADVHLDDQPSPAATTAPTTAPAPTPATPPGKPPPLNQGAAIAALGRAASGAGGCKRADGPSGAGRATVTFAPSGSVASVSIGSPFAGTAVGSCVAGRYRALTLPAFSGSPVTLGSSFVVPE